MGAFLGIISGFKKKIKSFVSNRNDRIPPKVCYTKDIFKEKRYLIGEYTYGCPTVFDWGEGSTLIVGKFCSIADDVKIFLGGNHRVDWVTTYPFNVIYDNFPNAIGIKGHPATKGDVVIGNDVWIGRGATIMSGVNIGDGAVIAANTVVSKSVNPYEIVAGNPGVIMKKRFDEETIDSLLKISWWDWSTEKINQEVAFMCSENIITFIERNIERALF